MKEFDPNNTYWWKPENLKKKESEYKSGKIDLTNNDDFGSYKIMLDSDNASKSYIHAHNDLNPEIKIKIVQTFINNNMHKQYSSIFNVGCGLGHETYTLAKVFKSQACGIDVSSDAIEYARTKFPQDNIEFKKITVDKNLILDQKYDAAFAFEFYPFTRTNDKAFN